MCLDHQVHYLFKPKIMDIIAIKLLNQTKSTSYLNYANIDSMLDFHRKEENHKIQEQFFFLNTTKKSHLSVIMAKLSSLLNIFLC